MPPSIVRYAASSVPILQMALSSPSLTASQLYDFGAFRAPQQLLGVPGMRLPLPFGGAPRQIQVDLDLQALTALGITPLEVSQAVSAQNLTLPAGQGHAGQTGAGPGAGGGDRGIPRRATLAGNPLSAQHARASRAGALRLNSSTPPVP